MLHPGRRFHHRAAYYSGRVYTFSGLRIEVAIEGNIELQPVVLATSVFLRGSSFDLLGRFYDLAAGVTSPALPAPGPVTRPTTIVCKPGGSEAEAIESCLVFESTASNKLSFTLAGIALHGEYQNFKSPEPRRLRGIYVVGTELQLYDAEMAYFTAGAIAAIDGTTSIAGSFLHNNVATSGGGFSQEGGTATLTLSVFRDNRAMESGGAVSGFCATLTFVRCVFIGNYAGVGNVPPQLWHRNRTDTAAFIPRAPSYYMQLPLPAVANESARLLAEELSRHGHFTAHTAPVTLPPAVVRGGAVACSGSRTMTIKETSMASNLVYLGGGGPWWSCVL